MPVPAACPDIFIHAAHPETLYQLSGMKSRNSEGSQCCLGYVRDFPWVCSVMYAPVCGWFSHRQLIFAAPACNQIGREEPVVKVANRNVFYYFIDKTDRMADNDESRIVAADRC